jgi:TolB protein
VRRWAAALAALAAAGAAPLASQRAPVLQQVKVRHPYYYREMFIPQVTSGPSSVA